jgi:hypothetical protein
MKLSIDLPSGSGSSWVYEPETSGVKVTQEADAACVGTIKLDDCHLLVVRQ